MICSCCPRKCNTERGKGFCKIPDGLFVSKFMLHKWEEPVISGGNGSGAIFFSGCNLKCCYCQNGEISGSVDIPPISEDQIVSQVKALLQQGADNVNLVSPTPYSYALPSLIAKIKSVTDKPIIYNSGGYDDVDALKALSGLVDVYLPDFKYLSPTLSKNYSLAENYPQVAVKAIEEMLNQQPNVVTQNGLIKKGVIIRHLVLPSHKDESVKIVRYIAENFKGAYLSLMRQYTPDFNRSSYKNLDRRLTSYEYEFVLSEAISLGLDGFSQEKQSADKCFTPQFKN